MIAEKKKTWTIPTVRLEAPIGVSSLDLICCIPCKTDQPCNSWQSHTQHHLLLIDAKRCSDVLRLSHVSALRYEPTSLIRGSATHFHTVSSTFVVLHLFQTHFLPHGPNVKGCEAWTTRRDRHATPHSPSPSPCPAIRRYRPLLLHLAIAGRVPSIRCTRGKHRLNQRTPPPRARFMVGEVSK